MALSSGFYNSVNGDRVYKAEQFGSLFDGLITDGVYQNWGSAFAVSVLSATSATLSVGTGRGWFNNTWLLNDAPLTVTLSAANATQPRWDALVIVADRTEGVRQTTIEVVQGSPAVSPSRPTITSTDTIKRYPLAYIYRVAAETSLSSSNVYDNRGHTTCPYVTSVVQTVTTTEIMARWDAVIDEWLASAQNVSGSSSLSGTDATRVATLEQLTLASNVTTQATSSPTDVVMWRPTGKGTSRAEPLSTFGYSVHDHEGPYAHNNQVRSVSLGTSITTDQQTQIRNGTFRGIWLGAYWNLGGRIWRVVDIDYFYSGGAGVTKHHVVLMPDVAVGNYQMGGTLTSNSYLDGFQATTLYSSQRVSWDNQLTTLIGNGLITYKESLSNLSNANGELLSASVVNVKSLPPSEIQLFGSRIRTRPVPMYGGANTYSPRQFRLFSLGYPYWINTKFWTRDQSAHTYFVTVDTDGFVSDTDRQQTLGYRPFIVVGY